jgi:iron(III) transport system permease protein
LRIAPRNVALRNSSPLVAAAVAAAVLAALPVVAVLGLGLAAGHGQVWGHLVATVLPGYVANTLALVVLVGAGVAFGGTVTAWLITNRRFPGARFFEWALLLPLAMPAYVMAYAYTEWLDYAGPVQTTLRHAFHWAKGDYWFPDVRSLGGAAAMFIAVLYPYVYLLARTAFLERPASLIEAARTLGLDARRAFWRVDLPLARPAIAGGIALALMETLADYGTVAYFAVDTFTTGIYRAWFSLGDKVAAAQLSAALLAFVVGAVLLERWSRGAARAARGNRMRSLQPPPQPTLSGWRAWTATLICVAPIVIGFALPLLLLGRLALSEPGLPGAARFGELAWNSFRVSGVTAFLAVVFAIVVAYAVRLAPGALTLGTSRLLALGYAVPGSVLAVGVLLPVGAMDVWLAEFMHREFGIRTGLLLTGTIAALIYAYLVRYFAVAWNGIDPAFARITPNMDAAARGLGSSTMATLLRVHAPLLARTAAASALLVFVDVMKELPATLVLRPFNFDTLATRTYTLAQDERLAEAALPSLAIVAVGVLPLLLLARAVRRGTAAGRHAPVPEIKPIVALAR